MFLGDLIMKKKEIIIEAGNYYTKKVLEHIEGPQASDWNSTEAQEVRFEQIAKILPDEIETNFTVCDFGCGIGDFESYIGKKYRSYTYYGYDVSAEMIKRAKELHGGVPP